MVDPSRPADTFRRLVARWATGVAVLTAHDGPTDAGLTVNALLSLSLDPPTLLASLMRGVDTLPVLERAGRFGVSLLAHDQRPLSERFARADPPAEKFRGLAFHRAPHGSPLLDGALAAFECRVVSRTSHFDHVVVIGEVEFQDAGRDVLPLVFFRSTYGEGEAPDRLRLPERRP